MDGGGVGESEQVYTSEALFFPVGSAAMSTDHLDWRVSSALLQYAE